MLALFILIHAIGTNKFQMFICLITLFLQYTVPENKILHLDEHIFANRKAVSIFL